MKPSMLDTDILSEYFRGNIKVKKRVESYLTDFNQIDFSIITYYEILNGLLYKDAKQQLSRFNNFCKLNRIVPLTMESVKISASLHADLRRAGVVIGHTDTLISGIALANNYKLITNNTNHFKHVPGLELENWLK